MASARAGLQTLAIGCLLLLGGRVLHSEAPPPIQVLTEEFPPYSYTQDGQVRGLSTEVVSAVLESAGLSYEIRILPWARALALAQSEPNTLIYSIGRNPQRETLFQWVGVIAPSDFYFFALAKREDVVMTALEDAKRFIIGTTRNDVREQYLVSKGFRIDVHLQSVTNQEQNVLKLFSERIDMTPLPSLLAYYLAEKNGHRRSELKKVFKLTEVSSEGYYMAFSLGTPKALVSRCQAALRKLKDTGAYERIQKKYLAP